MSLVSTPIHDRLRGPYKLRTDRCEFCPLACLLNCEVEEFLNESGYCEACKEERTTRMHTNP